MPWRIMSIGDAQRIMSARGCVDHSDSPHLGPAMSSQTTSARPNGTPSPAKERRAMTVPDFMSAKKRGVRLTVLTAYDYTMARLLDDAGVDAILVGDSLGMVVHGEANSLKVTL